MRARTRHLLIATGSLAAAALAASVLGPRLSAKLPSRQRARRSAQMARMGATTGSSYVAMKARGALASEDRREQLRVEFELRTAEQVAETLGGMKGAMM